MRVMNFGAPRPRSNPSSVTVLAVPTGTGLQRPSRRLITTASSG